MSTFVRKENTYDAGNIPVWLGSDRQLIGGGSFAEIPSSLPVTIPPAVPCYLNQSTGKVSLLKVFKVIADAASGQADVVIETPEDWTEIAVGDIVMVAPSTLSGSGQSYEITAIDSDTEGQLTISVKDQADTAELAAAIATDVLLVIGATLATDAVMAVMPNGVTKQEIRLEDGAYDATTPVVNSGSLLGDRIMEVPQCVKDALPMLTYNKG